MPYTDILIKILLAIAAGALVGYEHEKSKRPAGFRTHILSTLGAAVFTMIAMDLFLQYKSAAPGLDILRVVSGIAMGIGFIGGGAILHKEKEVSGLSAAASIWVMAAVGIAIGIGQYATAIMATIATFLVLIIVERMRK